MISCSLASLIPISIQTNPIIYNKTIMKGIIRKTGEEITIISYGGGIDRSDVLDYVSYIDSHGKEHPREKLNLYWDIEVINESFALTEKQANNAENVVQLTKETNSKVLTKKENVSLGIYTAIASGIYSKTGSIHWTPEDILDLTEKHVTAFMDRFVKEEKK